MLSKVEAVSARGEVLSLPLADLSGGYLVQDVSGLDPVKATIVSSPFALLDGTQYQSSRRENRNIVMEIGLEDGYGVATIRELRSRLYSFFMPKTVVTLRFYMDDVLFASIPGRVESCESPIFSKDPQMNISVLCFDPDFVAPTSTTVPGVTTAGLDDMVIDYPGTVETGIVFRTTLPRPITEFTIYNRPEGGEFLAFEFAALLSTGDGLEISTVSGAKRATLIRQDAPRSIMYGVSPAANWINLYPGLNHVRVAVEGAAIPFTIEYTAKYGGL